MNFTFLSASISDLLLMILASIVILSYVFSVYSKRTGIPSVLLLIGLGIAVGLFGNYFETFSFDKYKSILDPLLKILGTVGLVLIVLEAALDLKLLKEKVGLITRSFFVGLIGLVGTSLSAAWFISYFLEGMSILDGLLITIPLSVLSSAIILPSIDDLGEEKKEFMIYESTFSDILGILGFGFLVGSETFFKEASAFQISGSIVGEVLYTVLFSGIISYVLIYLFQKLKDHGKLFLLIAVLVFLYALGHMVEVASLMVILIFGMILNNYPVFFRGKLKNFVIEDRVNSILEDFKVVTIESAFVVRTFFFIIFGWSIAIGSLLDFRVWLFGVPIIGIIYLVRIITLYIFNGTIKIKKVVPMLFLAPRGLITILLFYQVKDKIIALTPEFLGKKIDFEGVLLLVILFYCLIMSWALVKEKRIVSIKQNEDFEILDGKGGGEDPIKKEGEESISDSSESVN